MRSLKDNLSFYSASESFLLYQNMTQPPCVIRYVTFIVSFDTKISTFTEILQKDSLKQIQDIAVLFKLCSYQVYTSNFDCNEI